MLLQAARSGQAQVQPAEAVALLWQAGKAWIHSAVSSDRNANHQGAAILTVTLPLLLLPTTNSPAVGSLIWLLLLPVLAWAVFRITGGAVARSTTKL